MEADVADVSPRAYGGGRPHHRSPCHRPVGVYRRGPLSLRILDVRAAAQSTPPRGRADRSLSLLAAGPDDGICAERFVRHYPALRLSDLGEADTDRSDSRLDRRFSRSLLAA